MDNEIIRSDAEISRVVGWAFEGRAKGSHYVGMSYENGIMDMLDWLTGVSEDAPDEGE